MSEEEKEAIKEIKNKLEYLKNSSMPDYNLIFAIEILLNLIDKLQKEFKDLELAYGLYKDKADKLQKEIEELKAINSMQKYRIEVIDEREFISKDKIKKLIKELDSISEHAYKNSNVGLGVGLNYAISKLKELLGNY